MMRAMQRRRLAWLLSLALMAIGGLFAHMLAYVLVAPHGEHRAQLLTQTGHDYHAHWRLCVAVCGAVALIGLGASVAERARGERPLQLPLWIFALVPPVGFVLQEHLERLLHTGTFPLLAALQPTFVVGILLQVPFALAAFLVARALLAFAAAIVRSLGSASRPRLASAAAWRRPRSAAALPRLSALALGHGPRAPPRLVAG